MKAYRDFQPTGFDCKGLGLEDQQDWLVLDLIRTRDTDSGSLEASNFECALRDLGGEGEDVEIHRFGHWGPGWFEIILVRPGSHAANVADEIERALERYPVLDEMDWSQREHEQACDMWQQASVRDRLYWIERIGRGYVSIFASRRDELPEGIDAGDLCNR